jgi:hypothetical protein
LIPQVLDLLLQLPHIAPVWSCEGHEPVFEPKKKPGKDFYIMFACTSSGFSILQELYERVRDGVMVRQLENDAFLDKFRKEQLAISGKEHYVGVLPDYEPFSPANGLMLNFANRLHPIRHAEWYNVVIFGSRTEKQKAKEHFFSVLMPVLQAMVDERREVVYKNVRLHNLGALSNESSFLIWPDDMVKEAIATFNDRRRYQTGEFGYKIDYRDPRHQSRHLQVHEDKASHMASNMRIEDNWIVVDIRVMRGMPYGKILYKLVGDTYPEFTDPAKVELPSHFKLRHFAMGDIDGKAARLAFVTVDFVHNPYHKVT